MMEIFDWDSSKLNDCLKPTNAESASCTMKWLTRVYFLLVAGIDRVCITRPNLFYIITHFSLVLCKFKYPFISLFYFWSWINSVLFHWCWLSNFSISFLFLIPHIGSDFLISNCSFLFHLFQCHARIKLCTFPGDPACNFLVTLPKFVDFIHWIGNPV